MRSESLRRLDSLPKAKPMAPQISSDEIARQVAEFEAGGGRIERLPGFSGQEPRPSGRPQVDPLSGRQITGPRLETADGEFLITMKEVTKIVGRSKNTVNLWRHRNLFPKPVERRPQVRWLESEIKRWAENHQELCGG